MARMQVGSTVAVGERMARVTRDYHFATDLAFVAESDQPYPHLAVVKQLLRRGSLVKVLWIYRHVDCRGRMSSSSLLRMPCSAMTAGGERVEDSGCLKEVFFSCHEDTIKAESVMHNVAVHFLRAGVDAVAAASVERVAPNGARIRVLRPGFVCRALVDPSDGFALLPLDPSCLTDASNADLLAQLLTDTEKRLGIASVPP